MYENVLTTICWFNKTETFGFIEEFNCSFLHCKKLKTEGKCFYY
ncbi:hypothetical protein DN068_03025 [Taibaiella soli]|uniref:Uncharacterized protein n=1 Tax=Taibaiella soli TaxID=1649169 RepID=A0A2W2B2Q6_9BACT|nr:hypothetical protein DN068_03025 [Taibaiella soli]